MLSSPWFRLAAVMVSGLLLTASFPPLSFAFLAWVALVPLVLALNTPTTSVREAARLGFLFGVVQFGVGCFWLTRASVAGWLFMALFSGGLFTAVFAVLFHLAGRRVEALPGRVLLFACLWTLIEVARSLGEVAFPWLPLAASQTPYLPVLQFAAITGQAGISFAIASVNGLLANALLPLTSHRHRLYSGVGALVIPTFLTIFGLVTLAHSDTPRSVVLAAVQGNVPRPVPMPQAIKRETVTVYTDLIKEAYRESPAVIVTPETIVPGLLFRDPVPADYFGKLAHNTNTYLLLGANDHDPVTDLRYNAAALVAPSGQIVGRYNKRHLVPGGESKPLKALLSPLYRLFGAPHTEYSAVGGDNVSPVLDVALSDEPIHLGVLICYESAFGSYAASRVCGGADVLTILTSDQLFGAGAGPRQHADLAILRAIEARRSVVRAASSGISCIVDPWGRTLRQIPSNTRGIVTAEVPVTTYRTLYAAYPLLFPLSLSLTMGFVYFRGRWVAGRRLPDRYATTA